MSCRCRTPQKTQPIVAITKNAVINLMYSGRPKTRSNRWHIAAVFAPAAIACFSCNESLLHKAQGPVEIVKSVTCFVTIFSNRSVLSIEISNFNNLKIKIISYITYWNILISHQRAIFFVCFSIRMYPFYFTQSFFKILRIKLFILYYNHCGETMYSQLLHIELLIE